MRPGLLGFSLDRQCLISSSPTGVVALLRRRRRRQQHRSPPITAAKRTTPTTTQTMIIISFLLLTPEDGALEAVGEAAAVLELELVGVEDEEEDEVVC